MDFRKYSFNAACVNHGVLSGYDEVAKRLLVKEDWQSAGTEWILMVKALS